MKNLDTTDRALISALRSNSRTSTSALGRTLGLSRTTVQDRINRLEREGVIEAYTIRFREDYADRQIAAHVMIQVSPKQQARIVDALMGIEAVTTLQTVSGLYDLVTQVEAATTGDMDAVLDRIGEIEGVEKTTTSIVLSTKLRR
ncbi:Lrp/AsnC family transcriptional regulator [Halioglobus pacificus]|uniref:Transcriptional regulator n=1 Tax=Parahalioglobus pacificus TaxID=930806 RepID=A0A919CJ74_9GAMM|nr:Lrp/AsnC family transcriptional regulator [Halioglobus pacificus]NQY02888.1 Lrp/AsnC family transcriptional regulator [Halieaceae bacterium]GHD30622.1 transcriptional regulator [Halioglobus pacificus]